ncbi:MAG: hypothetical protein HYW01_03530 [Deltaproteobacteria bacterium]|nr:hypothetical protein [Deltaproteobacteria bacterium]
MKKLSHNIRVPLLTCLLLGIMLTLSSPAYATWYYAHGQSGHIQDEGLVANYPFYYGWGLDFDLSAGSSNWVHFSIPTLGGGSKGVQYIRLKFKTGSADAWVSQIDVYDGNIKFKTLTGNWSGSKDVQLNLGQKWQINRALGISVRVNAGVEMMSHEFEFYAAGANFVAFP